MPDYLGDDSTTFDDIPEEHCRPRAYIEAEDIGVSSPAAGVLNNQAVIYQSITGKQLDGSTAYSGDAQAHDGDVGQLLGWALSNFSIDDREDVGQTERDLNAISPTIFGDVLAGTAYDYERIILSWPVFVPAGADICTFRLYADEKLGELSPILRSLNTSFVQQEPQSLSSVWYPGGYHEWPVYFASAGAVNILQLSISAEALDTGSNIQPTFSGGLVLPRYWKRSSFGQAPISVTNPTGRVTPLVGSSFAKIWDTLVAAGRSLSSRVTYQAAQNDGMLHELVTGSPAVGASSSTVTGHTHDGTTAGGATIDLALGSAALGWVMLQGAGVNGLTTGEGAGGFAPCITNSLSEDVWYNIVTEICQCPKRTGTVTLNWAVVLFDADGCGVDARVRESTDLSSWTASSTQSTDNTSGWHYLTGTIELTSETMHYLLVDIRGNGDGKSFSNDTYITPTGYCFWMT